MSTLKAITQHYFAEIEESAQLAIDSVPLEEIGLAIMLKYAMGWVDEHNQPYPHLTGKRLRPILLLMCHEASGGEWQEALPAAVAVELLHNFSLIHDDIQDKSPQRHNRPTVWTIWGIANAINAGDAMFTHAYQALSTLSNNFSSEKVLSVWQRFNETNLELTRGQHLDMQFETRNDVTVDEYLSMIQGKSAALLSACAAMGANLATTDSDIVQSYAEFGLNLGLAFQIRDDILGIWGDPEVTGKSAATDILSKKKSLPILYGLQVSADFREMFAQDTIEQSDVQPSIEALNAIEARAYTQQQEQRYYHTAMEALNSTQPNSVGRENLTQLIDFLFQRNY